KMKQEVVAKINKFGKIGEVIAQISRIFVILGAVILLAAGILMLAMPKDLFTLDYYVGMDMQVDLDAIGETVTDEDIEELSMEAYSVAVDGEEMEMVDFTVDRDNNTVAIEMASQPTNIFHPVKIVIFILVETLLMVVNFITITFIIKLCKEFKTCETPFSAGVIKRIKQVGFSLIPWCIMYPTAEAAANFMVSNNLNISIDIGMIIMVLVVLALAYIFQYGAMLQQESDETL
ncbi:MAG: DUF2975 domain-containing protein, partial [Lachnospiraceae bacterium]|nr:DUF2975 domain-containing protein [Lachnospiraceae bacterium]